MRLRASLSGCPNFAEICWISMENKLLEVAKNAQKLFDRKSEFCFGMFPSVFAFRCQECTVNQQYEPYLFSLSVNHCKKNIDGK